MRESTYIYDPQKEVLYKIQEHGIVQSMHIPKQDIHKISFTFWVADVELSQDQNQLYPSQVTRSGWLSLGDSREAATP